MAGDIYPRFRATAVQAAPVFLDREATISKSPDFKRRGIPAIYEWREFVTAGELTGAPM
jgi:hypothetical protein